MSFSADGSLVSGQLRIAAVSIAAFDIIRTIPLEWHFYKSSSLVGRSLLGAVRYVGIAALVANAALYFSGFTQASCHSVHLLPGILQLFAGFAVQIVIFYRTIDVTQRDKTALAIMIFGALITVPLESVAIGLNRVSTLFANELTKVDGCLSLVPEATFNAGPVFYLAHFVFDFFAIVLSSYHLMRAGGRGTLLARLLDNGIVLIFIDAVMNFVTFLASIGVSGIQNLGSICSIVTSILIAQHILFLTRVVDAPAQEYNHEIVALPQAMYKGSAPFQFNSSTSLPRFATPKRTQSDNTNHQSPSPNPYNRHSALGRNSTTGGGVHRSVNSLDGSSILRSCVGREALKYRVDGDVNMFQSKTSLSLPAGEEAKRPISLDVKRLSHLSHLSQLSQQGRSPAPKSRPTTAGSSDLSQ